VHFPTVKKSGTSPALKADGDNESTNQDVTLVVEKTLGDDSAAPTVMAHATTPYQEGEAP
jgi:hypothetical protein